jgi:hypothetical protein
MQILCKIQVNYPLEEGNRETRNILETKLNTNLARNRPVK